jgi:hypothetical protein
MVVRNLERVGAEPPADWWERNREAARRITRRAMVLSSELIRLQGALRAISIPSIAVKGPALGVRAHGTPMLRMMADLDLVVRESDLESAFELLLSRGYQPMYSHGSEVRNFAHRGRAVHLEVHRRLDKRFLPLFPLNEAVWSSLHQVELMGAPVDVLPLELGASFLIYHGSRHHWHRLGWLSVFVDLLQREPQRLDGEALVRDAVCRGNGAMARLTAVLVRETWPDIGTVLPVLPGRSRSVRGFSRRVRASWAQEEPPRGIRAPRWVRYLRLLRSGHHTVLLADHPVPRLLAAARFVRMVLEYIAKLGRRAR